jgi:hypothetical protein
MEMMEPLGRETKPAARSLIVFSCAPMMQKALRRWTRQAQMQNSKKAWIA